MRHQEEIKSSIYHFALLNEALVDVGTLRRVVNEGLVLCVLGLLEETLAHALVHNDQRDLGAHRLVRVWVVRIHTVLLLNDGIELLEFEVDDLLAHGIADTVTVDEDVLRHFASVELAVGGEGPLEVVRKHSRRDDFLAFLWLR